MDVGPSETRPVSSSSHPIDPGGFAPGTMLADRYRIVALVGRGGMGEVYRAEDLRLGQTVALKFLPATLAADTTARDRLLAEVRNARSVSHPNVCRVYDIGDVAGRAFLTMEYIDGEDLASLLRRIGRLPATKALEIARQLCAGLAAAHDKGVLHRDLKPANVMIDGRGQARITDFGLAVETGAAGVPADVAGTVAYMAPERFQGAPATVQSDLYALGLILYETYTGKPTFKAGSFLEWQQAHRDSTPTSPSALATDVEPAVERAILRCLEKDPAKRPASAALVAAALPGGDPLAAALAAGETPSPELVAASGEEGTLPRWQAWLWFAACLVALAIVPLTLMPFNLVEHVAFDLTPDVLRARAREILHDLGYRDRPADHTWRIRPDAEYLDHLNGLRPSEAAAEIRTAVPGPLLFCYRQSPTTAVSLGPRDAVTTTDPPPEIGDTYVELDLRGRLVALRVVPPRYGATQQPVPVNWTALFAAGQLGPPDKFVELNPTWWPEGAPDVRAAREGIYAGQQIRVEAGARAGRPIFFRLLPPWAAPPPPPGTPENRAVRALKAAETAALLLSWISLIVLAGLARRNLRLGRADRTAARRLAIGVIAVAALSVALEVHSTLDLFTSRSLAPPLVAGLFAWVAYLGFEPPMRRTWPRLLIASTRLINLQWRDPLVGRALLIGVLVGLLYSHPTSVWIHRLLDLPGGGPTNFIWRSLDSGRLFVQAQIDTLVWVLMSTLGILATLFVIRLIVRRADVAWVVFSTLFVGMGYLVLQGTRPPTTSLLLLLGVAAVFNLMLVWVLWRHGALAFVVAWLVGTIVQSAPWTLDMTRWYWWRGWFVVAVVAGLAFWGFRNALGRQSMLPAGALDA